MANVVEDLQRGTAAINNIEAALKAKGVIRESEEVPVEDFDDRIDEIVVPQGPYIEFSDNASFADSKEITLKKTLNYDEYYTPNGGAQSHSFEQSLAYIDTSIEHSDISNAKLTFELEIPPFDGDLSEYDSGDSMIIDVRHVTLFSKLENLKIALKCGYNTKSSKMPAYSLNYLISDATYECKNLELILQNVKSVSHPINSYNKIDNIYIKIDPTWDSEGLYCDYLASNMDQINKIEIDSSKYGEYEGFGYFTLNSAFSNTKIGQIILNLNNLKNNKYSNPLIFNGIDLTNMIPSSTGDNYPITISGNCPFYKYMKEEVNTNWDFAILDLSPVWAIDDNGTIKEYINMKKLIQNIENTLAEFSLTEFPTGHEFKIKASSVIDTTMYDANNTVEEKLTALGVIISRDNA